MQTVNWHMLNDLMNPLGGTGDIDEKIYQYRNFDNNNEIGVKKIIMQEIKPYYEKAPDAYKTSLKRSLSYFLTTDRIDFGRLYDSCLIAFNHPTNPKDFFVWIWQELFIGEDYYMEIPNNNIEIDDPQEPYQYWIAQEK